MPRPGPSTVIVMGVAGSGKTTVGRALADRLGWRFCDADLLHSAENVDRLRRGIPLTDRDREPWLRTVRAAVAHARDAGDSLVLACSALKQRYRDTIAAGLAGVRFVFLDASPRVLSTRLERRTGHFAGPALLESQLADLEPPADALRLDGALPVDALVDLIVRDVRSTG